jgi:2-amino-4-hydroxy-6-hydroxymethyldihydropteridine diphosphokinase
LNAVEPNDNHLVYIGLGSNIDPENNFKLAVIKLREVVEVLDISTVWETPPVGTPGANFLNAVAKIRTDYSIRDFRDKVLRKIESELGRIRTSDPNAPRSIDLDILIFDGCVIDNEIWSQVHIAFPLSELFPNLSNPDNNETLDRIAERLVHITPIQNRADIFN